MNSSNRICILFLKVMGAYLSAHPRLSMGVFYGTGESFVFHWTSPDNSSCHEDILTAENATSSEGSTFKVGHCVHVLWCSWWNSSSTPFFIACKERSMLLKCAGVVSTPYLLNQTLSTWRAVCLALTRIPSEKYLISVFHITVSRQKI